MLSNEYIGSLAIVVVSILKLFKVEIASDQVQGLIVGVIALWVAFKRYQKGDINVLGRKV